MLRLLKILLVEMCKKWFLFWWWKVLSSLKVLVMFVCMKLLGELIEWLMWFLVVKLMIENGLCFVKMLCMFLLWLMLLCMKVMWGFLSNGCRFLRWLVYVSLLKMMILCFVFLMMRCMKLLLMKLVLLVMRSLFKEC